MISQHIILKQTTIIETAQEVSGSRRPNKKKAALGKN